MSTVRSVASDNTDIEFNNKIVTEMEDRYDETVKPCSPSGMLGLMKMLVIFDVESIYC